MADTLLDGLARHLEGKALLTYDPDGTAGDCALEHMPSGPDEVVVLTLYGGPEPDGKLGYDEPNLQVKVRGTADPQVSRDRCKAIYDELHGLGPVTLPDGTQLLSCFAIQARPASLGVDANGRHEHVVNYRLYVRSITTHRV
ncbi:minor capsid protein [Streptomyces albicerus]|uniref:minor capsid protein n=1 Tax=Streptomyces albicerus TaxID=2569859 RepID=UPI00124B6293|nr:minor capsid protein [Streptomyces albicerus]